MANVWCYKRIISDARSHPKIPTDVFVQMTQLQAHPNCIGAIFRTRDFANNVKAGALTDYDGFGYYLSEDGKTEVPIGPLDVQKIRNKAAKYPFIHWCNK